MIYTPNQQEALDYRDGNLLIIACAGSGKTQVLSRRIALLISEGVPRDSIVAFTFTDMYCFSEHRFVYPFHFETHVEREQTVKPGEAIQLFAPAEDGGYTATCRDSTKDFIIDLEQPNMAIAYTDRYRYAEPDSINPSTNHLMLPLLIQTDSGNVLP